MRPPKPHRLTVGDTGAPIKRTLTADGVPVDLTGKEIEFKMIASDGTVKVDWTTANVTVSAPASSGGVQYDFQSVDVNTAGTFYAWFRIADTGDRRTFPSSGRTHKVIISAAA